MRTLRTIGGLVAFCLAVVACGQASSRLGSTSTTPTATGGVKGAAATLRTAASPGASSLQAQFIAVVRKVNPSVVQIETSTGLGSGVVYDTAGHIVTNNHVVEGATNVRVTLANGKRYAGTVVNTFAPDDLAVVKISASGLHPIAFARSSQLQVGQFALAVGNPLGLRSSVTMGIVSAVNRTVNEGSGTNAAIAQAVQTSAPINPGNSGGALVDLSGRLIGIPTLAASDPQIGGAAVGIGFAIPSDTVKDIASQIIKNGKVVNSHRAYLGVSVGDVVGGGGVYVSSVTPGGPAATAGVQAGDIILSVAGRQTPTTDDLTAALVALRPGQTISVVVRGQDGTQRTVKLTLGQYPGS